MVSAVFLCEDPMIKSAYPEYHSFSYIACVPWPNFRSTAQIDWIEGLSELELWLIDYTGPRWVAWCWAESQHQKYYEISVAFKKPQYKTLCLLRWGM